MKRRCKLSLLLLVFLLLAGCAKDPLVTAPDTAHVFTDSTGHTVALNGPPSRVAVLFSSLADVWTLAGGEVAVTVGESVERGICEQSVTLVDDGAGKSINTELLIAAAPDLVLVSADVPAQLEAAVLLREAGIPTAALRIESFTDYLAVLKLCTDITGRADLYKCYGTDQAARIAAAVTAKPLEGERILFVRAGTSARSVKPKGSADHFAAAILQELGATNIADNAPLLADGLSMEYILQQDPDHIFFVAMGDETASHAYVNEMLKNAEWQTLSAVQAGKVHFLPKERFHYKPSRHWADCYEQLAETVAAD